MSNLKEPAMATLTSARARTKTVIQLCREYLDKKKILIGHPVSLTVAYCDGWGNFNPPPSICKNSA